MGCMGVVWEGLGRLDSTKTAQPKFGCADGWQQGLVTSRVTYLMNNHSHPCRVIIQS